MKNKPAVKTILLIEDNDDHAEIIDYYLKEIHPGLTIRRLTDGQAAMNFIRSLEQGKTASEAPCLILLDLNLPYYNGHELLQVMKSNEKMRAIPIIILTTSDSINDRKKAFESYANSYLVKPTSPDEFQNLMQLIMEYWNKNSLLDWIHFN